VPTGSIIDRIIASSSSNQGSTPPVSITANSPPVVEANKTVSTSSDQSVSLSISTPSDPNGDPLTITVTSVPNGAGGKVVKSNNNLIAAQSSLTPDELTQLIFQPNTIAEGSVGSFSYSVSDGRGGTSSASVNLVVIQLNPSPKPLVLTGDDNPNNLIGETLNDTLSGLGGDDTLNGAAGNDILDGGALNDLLIGGLGADTMTGGGGTADVFGYLSPSEGGLAFDAKSISGINTAIATGGYDVITDFLGLGSDDIDKINFASAFPNVKSFAQILPSVQSTVDVNNILGGTTFLFAYESGGSTYLIYDGNGDNTLGNDSRILAKLQGVTQVQSLDANDFTFI